MKNQTILGIGTDIIEVARIKDFAKNTRALERVFTKEELEYSLSRKNKYEHLAVRFAAKEAVYKACSLEGLALRDIEVKNLPSGKPVVVCKDKRAAKFNIMLSLSHTKKYANAICIITK